MKPHDFALPYLNIIKDTEAKFLLEHAEKTLKDTLDTNSLIVGRVTTLITVTSGIMIALFGFAINKYDNNKAFDNLLITTVVGLVYMMIISFVLFRIVMPRVYKSPGSLPRDLLNDNLFNEQNADKRMTWIYVNEIHEIQGRIEHNKEVNEKRWAKFKTALVMILLAPLILTLSYWLLGLFRC
jgi:hypothetical protein